MWGAFPQAWPRPPPTPPPTSSLSLVIAGGGQRVPLCPLSWGLGHMPLPPCCPGLAAPQRPNARWRAGCSVVQAARCVFRRLERAREAAPLGPGRGVRVWVGYMGASGSPGRRVTWRLWPCGHSACPWAPLPGVSTSGGARQAPWCESERARAGAGGRQGRPPAGPPGL